MHRMGINGFVLCMASMNVMLVLKEDLTTPNEKTRKNGNDEVG